MSTNFKLKWMKEGNIMKYAKTISTVLLLASLLAACGSGGGGGGGGGGGSAPLAAGTFVKTYGSVNSGGEYYPFSNGDVKHQTLYTASEVGGTGKISALHFRRALAVATPVTCPNATVRLGHTGLSALTSDFASNIDRSSSVTALNNATVTIPAGAAGTWFEIPFTTPFGYNGVDNLVVEIEKTAGCTADVSVTIFDAATSRRAFSYAVDSNPDTAQHNLTVANWVDVAQLWAKFAFAGGEDKINLGGAGSNSWPFVIATVGVSERPRIQNLYLASEINGSGPVTGIAFQMNATSPGSNYTYSLKLGHSTLAALGNTFSDNYSGSPTTVANAVTFSIPAGIPAGEWVWVPIPNGVFTYNGTDNLIVEVATSSGTASTLLRYASIAGRRVWVNDTTGTATFGTVDPAVNHIALRFNGAPVQVMPLTNDNLGMVLGANDPGGQIQNLYDSTSLGTGGRITNVAVRLSGPTFTATSLANYKVYMGHTAKTQYNVADTYASNMDENMLVFNGTLTIPAGLKQGDWVTVPLQTPFTYDPSKNLSILFMSNFDAEGSRVYVHSDSTRFPAHAGYRADNAVGTGGTPSWTFDGAVNVQLQIEK